MNKLKFFHPITGKSLTVSVPSGIMRSGAGGKIKQVISISKVCNHMWSQGYVRAGKNVVLTDFEKAAIKAAPAYIAQMKEQIAKHEADGSGLITGIVDCMRGDFKQPERKEVPLAFSTPAVEPMVQIETKAPVDKLAALKAARGLV